MPIVNLAETNSVLSTFVSELRDTTIQKDSLRFRANLVRIGEILAYEMSKVMQFETRSVTTPLGTHQSAKINESLVIGTILRAGLPLHQGILSYFDRSENAFVSAYRKYTDKEKFDIHVEYISSPSIEGKTLVLADPMLATGNSFELAYKALLSKGNPIQVHLACAIASTDGVEYLKKALDLSKIYLWCADVDPELNHKSYIVPGLGDAGDLAYGIKL